MTPDRTPEDREQARLDREARRQGRAPAKSSGGGGLFGRGRKKKDEPEPPLPPGPEPEPLPPESEPLPPEPEPLPPGPEPEALPPGPEPEPLPPEPEPLPPEPQPEPAPTRVRAVPPEARERQAEQRPAHEPPPQGGWRPPRKRTADELRERFNRASKMRQARVPAPGAPRQAEPLPRRRRRILLAAAPVLLVLVAIWFLFSTFQPLKGDGEGKVRVVVPEKASVGDIGKQLEKQGVIDSSFFFQVRTTVGGDRGALRPGSYTLAKGMSYSAAIGELTQGPPANVVQVAVPEGRSRSEVADIVKEAGLEGSYSKASIKNPELNPARYGGRKAKNLEGFLFPSTYELKKGASSRAFVRQQLTTFKKNFRKVDLKAARKANLSPYEVLIIASMIDREAQLAKERPVISSVIYNRLRDDIPLGIDATIRFAADNWSEPLTESDLKISSPYNTRTRQGLPPGPIGSPGLAAIRAAARPRKTGFLYYVVKPGSCGEHAFSKTFEQFQKDARRYDTARKQRGGKSPQDC